MRKNLEQDSLSKSHLGPLHAQILPVLLGRGTNVTERARIGTLELAVYQLSVTVGADTDIQTGSLTLLVEASWFSVAHGLPHLAVAAEGRLLVGAVVAVFLAVTHLEEKSVDIKLFPSLLLPSEKY